MPPGCARSLRKPVTTGFAIKVTDEQGNRVAYMPIGKRCN
jgi:hypothetical protein